MPYERFKNPSNTTSIEDLERSQPSVEKFIRSQHNVPENLV